MPKQSSWERMKHYAKEARAFLGDDSNPLSWLANLALAFIVIKFILYPLLGLLFGSTLPVVAVVSSSMDHDALDGSICGVAVSETYQDTLDTYWNTCGGWYESRNIDKETFQSYPFRGGFNKGDIMVIVGPQRGTIEVGDVIVFQAQQQYPIIHRVVSVQQRNGTTYYSTKGDHNPQQIAEYVVVDPRGFASYCEQNGVAAPCSYGRRVTADTPGAVALFDEINIPREAVIGRAVLRIPWFGWVKIGFSNLVQGAAGLFR
jgi:signal peptidase I